MILARTVIAMAFTGLLAFPGATLANIEDYNSGFKAAESHDYKSAVEKWGPLAEQGNPIAQFNLAVLYHSGSGVPLDEAEAVKWYTKSAENGYYKAQEYLAVGYAEGWFGLPVDKKKAAYWQKRIDSGK